MSRSIEELTSSILAFRDARDWSQFHNPKDLALALSIEASELNERFLWKSPDEADRAGVQEELADVLIYALLLAHHYEIDIPEAIREKLALNEERYPVEKSKGSARKYDELD